MERPSVLLLTGRAQAGKDQCAALLKEQGFQRVAFADTLRTVLCLLWNAVGGICKGTIEAAMRLGDDTVDADSPDFTTYSVEWPTLTPAICEDPAQKDAGLALGVTVTSACVRMHESVPMAWPDGRPVTPRSLLIFVGTDVGRTHLGDDVWVRAALRKIAELKARSAAASAAPPKVVVTDVRFPNEAYAAMELPGFVVKTLRVKNPHQPPDAAQPHISETAMESFPAPELLNDKSLGITGLQRTLAATMSTLFSSPTTTT